MFVIRLLLENCFNVIVIVSLSVQLAGWLVRPFLSPLLPPPPPPPAPLFKCLLPSSTITLKHPPCSFSFSGSMASFKSALQTIVPPLNTEQTAYGLPVCVRACVRACVRVCVCVCVCVCVSVLRNGQSCFGNNRTACPRSSECSADGVCSELSVLC